MRTLTEIVDLAREAASLWWRRYPQLLMWFCLGFGVHRLGQHGSALVGSRYQLLATMLFVLGVLGYLAALVLMIHTLKASLWSPGRVDAVAAQRVVPQSVFLTERGVDVLTLALAPFLAVYSVWGLVEDEVSALLFANLSREGMLDPDVWSISFDPDLLGFYATLTILAWLLAKGVGLVRTRRADLRDGVARALRAVAIVADGTAVFGLFVALGIVASSLQQWWQGRQLAVWLGQAWRGLTDLLPDWQLWTGLRLPEAMRELATWFWTTVLPTMSERVLLPLMWLALTATVFGWREFRGHDIVAGTRLATAAGRFGGGAGRRTGALPTAARLATEDLRVKYLPVANALRLVWHAGPRFVGAYLVLATALWAAQVWGEEALVRLIGPQPLDVVFALEPFIDLLSGAVFVTASVALYAAAFDRAVAEVTGTPWRTAQRVSRSTVS